MFERFIASFDAEMAYLHSVGNAGFTLGFRYKMQMPPLLHNGYPQRWQARYDEKGYLFKDPTVIWFNDYQGQIRWSALPYADSYGVMADARYFGLKYGAVFSIHHKDSRNWLTIARNDRELTDIEMATLWAKFETWTNNCYGNVIQLDPKEAAVLRLFGQGLDRAAVAAELGVSISTVKLYQSSAQKRLGAKSRSEALKMATSLNLLTP